MSFKNRQTRHNLLTKRGTHKKRKETARINADRCQQKKKGIEVVAQRFVLVKGAVRLIPATECSQKTETTRRKHPTMIHPHCCRDKSPSQGSITCCSVLIQAIY